MCKACPNYFFGGPLAPRLANAAFVESRVLAEVVTICCQGPLQRPNRNLAPKTSGFSFLSQNLRLTNVCAQPPPKNTPGTCFQQTLPKKKGHFVVLEVFCAKIGQIGACRWACRSMSLGMSQHVAAMFVRVDGHVATCRSTFGICRWACRSMSCHFLGVLRHFAGAWAIFWQKNSGFGPCQRPSVFFRTARVRTNVRRFQFFLPKGNWAEGGGFHIPTRVK